MRRQIRCLFLTTSLALVSTLGEDAYGQQWAKLSPFTKVSAKNETAVVRFDGKLYELVSIDNLPTKNILDFAKKRYGGRWEKRFAEDLVEVMAGMGHPPGKTVKLVLRDPKSRKLTTVAKAPMTHENRQAVWRSRQQGPNRDPRQDAPPTDRLTKQQMTWALDVFQQALRNRWSYYKANDADFPAAIGALRKKIDAGIAGNDFAIELQKIVALGVDGHARVSGYHLPGGALPFLIDTEGERFVAFHDSRKELLDAGHPYITAIDGRGMDEWIKAASVLVCQGSPQYVRRHSLRHLRSLQYSRSQLKLEAKDRVEVELVSRDGTSKRKLGLPVADRPPTYGIWPRTRSQILRETIGYLRIPTMGSRGTLREIKQQMARFCNTTGLIVDVRDNGGGSRHALRLLFSYLCQPDDVPRVINAAAYRLHPEHPEDHLTGRFLHREGSATWTKPQRTAIAAFRQTFRPQWKLPEDEFSDWHYMVLARLDDDDVYHYTKPVIVLMNGKCFSATDIFLAGLKGWRNVTLVGTPSGGGSARSQSIRLGETQITLRIGSMASFQPGGKPFDGHGVQPDVRVEPDLEYYIGGRDNVLEKALEMVRKRRVN